MAWPMIVAMIVIAAAAYAFTPRPPSPQRPAPGKLELPTTEAGTSIPVVFGTREIQRPNLVYWGGVSTDPIRKRGGKK